MARKRTGKRVEVDGGYRVVGKAANGDGTVFWDKSINAWRVRWVDVHGKPRSTSGPTREEALARRAAREAVAPKTAGPLGDDPTVADLARWWLSVHGPTVRVGTRRSYRADVARIVAGLGSARLDGLDRAAVRGFLVGMSPKYRASTISNTRTRLSQVCAAGVELGVLDRNPAKGAPIPKDPPAKRRARRALTIDETRRLLGVLDARFRWDAAVAILYTAGCRASEVLGLAWADVDLDGATAVIRRGVTYAGSDGDVVDQPKTARTYGTVHLSPTVVGLLRRHRGLRAEETLRPVVYEGAEVDLVFRGRNGGPGRQQHLYRAVRRALGRAGVDTTGVGTHTGRRTVVTSLYQAGLALSDIADLVGHADVATTAQYVTDLGQRPAQVAARAHTLLDPAAEVEGG